MGHTELILTPFWIYNRRLKILLRRLVIMISICLLITFIGQVSAWKYYSSDSGWYPNPSWLGLKVDYYAKAGAWASEDENGYFSVWAEVDSDRYRNSGVYSGGLTESGSKSQTRWTSEAAPSLFDSASIN